MRIPLFAALLSLVSCCHGQTLVQQAQLRQLSADCSLRWTIERRAAIGMPRIIAPGAELVGLHNGRPLIFVSCGFEAADTVSADEVWPTGSTNLDLTGSGVILGQWDEGVVQESHPDLTGRVTEVDGTTTGGSHATPVAGIMIASGVDLSAKGFAFQATINAYKYDNDHAEMALAAGNGLRASNHSYGTASGWLFNAFADGRWVWLGDPAVSATTDYTFGFYGQTCAELDAIAFNAPYYTMCQAVGNDRNQGPTNQPTEHWVYNGGWVLSQAVRDKDGAPFGYDCLMQEACSKNVISVGAVDQIQDGYTSQFNMRLISTTSFGPTDDGRIKPDLVACGGNVKTTAQGGGYLLFGQTSASTPNVTGSIGLLLQEYRGMHGGLDPLSSTLRALLIHTADESGSDPGPDYRFGWGLMDVKNAGLVMADAATHPNVIVEGTLNEESVITYQVSSDGTEPLKVTLCWTDPAATSPAPALNDRTPMLTNDLDVRITDGVNTWQPWVLDPNNPSSPATNGDNTVDNVEQIVIPAPAPGLYTITVGSKPGSLQPAGHQVFSLIMTGRSKINLAMLTTVTAVTGGSAAEATVTTDAPVPAGTGLVNLSSNNAAVQVPASVTIADGASSAKFDFTTTPVPVPTQVTLTANRFGVIRTRMVIVRAPILTSVTFSPNIIAGSQTSTGTVRINAPAAAGGYSADISDNSPYATAPASVLIPAGATSVTFQVTTTVVTSNITCNFQAKHGYVVVGGVLTILPTVLSSFSLSPISGHGGMTVTATVTLAMPAPPGGATVLISSANQSLAPVPTSVLVPGGQTTKQFSIVTGHVTSATNIQIAASRAGIVRPRVLTLVP